MGPSNSTPRDMPKRTENTCLHKGVYLHAHSCVVGNKRETAQMSMAGDEKISKGGLAQDGTLFSRKRNETVTHATTWMNFGTC